MPLGGGASEAVGVTVRDGVLVLALVSEGVADSGCMLGEFEAMGSREEVTVTAGVLETVAAPVRVLLGELGGVPVGVPERGAAERPTRMLGGITTPR